MKEVNRTFIGGHIARFYSDDDKKVKLFIAKEALDDGSIVLLANEYEPLILSLPKEIK